MAGSATVTVDVKLNKKGIGEMLRSGDMAAEMHGRAEQVKAAAVASAPRATGAYAESISVTDDTTDRAVSRISVGVAYGGVVEANTGNLGRALDAAKG